MKSSLKNYWFLLILAGLFFSPVVYPQSIQTTAPQVKVEVVYFHAPNRCPACVANETQTKKTLENHFKNELSKGFVSFVSLDLKAEKNQALVNKFEIVFPTLLIIRKQGSRVVKTDYTSTAYAYAMTEPRKYENLLKAEILKQMNSK